MNRVAVGGIPYHVINRANGRVQIFNSNQDYQHFEALLLGGVESVGVKILSYCIMSNHWHLAVNGDSHDLIYLWYEL